MAADPHPPTPLFNPVAFWADASMAAMDQALSSTQNIGDGADRMARAGAGADPAAAAAAARSPDSARPASLGLGLGPAMQLQSTMFNLLSQAWQQWFATLGSLASLGAGATFKDAERQTPWLDTLRQSLAADAAATSGAGSTPARGRGARNHEPAVHEHALAAAAAETRTRPRKARPASRARVKR